MKRVSVGVLPNGFRFYTHFTPWHFVSGIGVMCGSIHDPRTRIGMTHIKEHILGVLGEKEELKLEEYGCGPGEGINVRVDRSSTFYGHDDVLKREFMLELFDIFAGSVPQPGRITKEALERERAAVLNEYYLVGKDWVQNAIDDWMHAAMYEDVANPAGSRIDCEPAHLLQMRVADLKRFYLENYGSDTMFAIMTGIPFEKVKDMMQERFGHLKPTGRSPLVIPEIRPKLRGVKYVEVEKQGINLHHVAIGFPTWAYGHKDDIALDLLGYIWQWRLRQALRQANREWGKGTYRVFVSTPRTFAHGMIYIWFATPSREFADEGAKKILAECTRLREEFVPNDLLTTFWNKLYYRYKSAFEYETGELCEMIIEAACNGDAEMQGLNSYIGRLQRVGKKAVRRIANEYFTPPYVHLLVKPTPSTEPLEKVNITWKEVTDTKVPPQV